MTRFNGTKIAFGFLHHNQVCVIIYILDRLKAVLCRSTSIGVLSMVFISLTKITRAAEASGEAQASYGAGSLLIVALLLLVLALLFVLMMYYSHRIEQSGHVAELLRGALFSVERQKNASEINDAWNEGEYHFRAINDASWLAKHSIPEVTDEEVEKDAAVSEALRQLMDRGRIGTLPPYLKERSQEATDFLLALHHWEETDLHQHARDLRTKDLQWAEERAREKSGRILGQIDLGTIWGRGPEFVLQFTAVVTIIFAVIALGILERLDSETAGTILAAIAGYVLGQATSRREPSRSSSTLKETLTDQDKDKSQRLPD